MLISHNNNSVTVEHLQEILTYRELGSKMVKDFIQFCIDNDSNISHDYRSDGKHFDGIVNLRIPYLFEINLPNVDNKSTTQSVGKFEIVVSVNDNDKSFSMLPDKSRMTLWMGDYEDSNNYEKQIPFDLIDYICDNSVLYDNDSYMFNYTDNMTVEPVMVTQIDFKEFVHRINISQHVVDNINTVMNL